MVRPDLSHFWVYENTCTTSVLCIAYNDDAAHVGIVGNRRASHGDDRRWHMHGCRISPNGGREGGGDPDFDDSPHAWAWSGRDIGSVRRSCESQRQTAAPKVIKGKTCALEPLFFNDRYDGNAIGIDRVIGKRPYANRQFDGGSRDAGIDRPRP